MVRVKNGTIYYTTPLRLGQLFDTRTSELHQNPLGKASHYPQEYAPEVLCAVSRQDARKNLELGEALPFHGEDIWNAWELTWLDKSGRPVVATATIRIPCDSENIVESKSLKLYLNSFAMTRYDSAVMLQQIIEADLSKTTNCKTKVALTTAAEPASDTIGQLPGTCIDNAEGDFSANEIDPTVLASNEKEIVAEELHSHLLRSNCPVTNQPDMGSVLIRYQGPKIDKSRLLQYIVSFRQHNDFHEACVERMFIHIKQYCKPQRLTVYARYTRRGGIDINPFRSDFEDAAENIRLWRQ
jgi:7-cyano-7-deazaguanine reductase